SGEQFTTVITDDAGTLSAHGVFSDYTGGSAVVTGSGSSSLSITGTAAEVNAALDTLDYTGTGADTITVTTTDLGDQNSVSKNIGVNIQPAANFTSLEGVAYGINSEGQIVGTYNGNGFVYNGGTYTTLNNTPQGINDSGNIVGFETTGLMGATSG